MKVLIVGIFHPVINWCGGAEWVAINIINTLKNHGHKVVILTDQKLDQEKIMNIFGKYVAVDAQIVFPLAFFPPTDYHNIYTDAFRSLILKSKCDVVVDAFSNSILPGTDFAYIHFPLLKRLPSTFRSRIFSFPHRVYARGVKNLDRKIFFSNSEFTADAISKSIGVKAHVLYPPVSSFLLNHSKPVCDKPRKDVAVTVARISESTIWGGKNLNIIPYIAKLTDRSISFLILGVLESERASHSILKLLKKHEVADRVKILTDVPAAQLRACLENSKVYFHPAINEHFGVSIVEAMASGCIPIVHDSGGPREFVPKDLRYRNMEEAVMKIERAVTNWSPEIAKRISKIPEKFSEKNFSRKFMTIFNSYVPYKR